MNSPPDPGSPISTDTESPPPEEIQSSSTSTHLGMNLASQLAQFGNAAKRRLPGGGAPGGPSAMREPKTRRRMEQGKGGGNVATAQWDTPKEAGKREERELVDHALVEFLRKGTFCLIGLVPNVN
ncbi:hypothetical protein DXG01_003373 [Tephrocybe rancida]|nr:hypothetical protein DXG01_003373 [Tephrocybe rancida]